MNWIDVVETVTGVLIASAILQSFRSTRITHQTYLVYPKGASRK